MSSEPDRFGLDIAGELIDAPTNGEYVYYDEWEKLKAENEELEFYRSAIKFLARKFETEGADEALVAEFMVIGMQQATIKEQQEQYIKDAETLEKCVKLALSCSLSTGHADTLEELFIEVCGQAKDFGARMVEAEAENERLKNPWIDVNDRLPESGVRGVLIRYNGGVVLHVNYTSLDKSFRTGKGQEVLKVTHWMPIPPIPETKEEELK